MSQMTFTIDTTDLASVRALAALAEALYNGDKKQPAAPALNPIPAPVQQSAPAAPIQPPASPTQQPSQPVYQQQTLPYQQSTAQPTYQQTPPAVPTAAAPQPAPASAPAPVPAQMPTAAPSYTLDQLGLAGSQLIDAGRRVELINLLASFGVQGVNQLPPDRYGDFATALRGMGAKI